MIFSKTNHSNSLFSDSVRITQTILTPYNNISSFCSTLHLPNCEYFFTGVEETVELVKSNGGDIRGYKCDLSNRQNVYEIAKKTKQEVGDVSIPTAQIHIIRNI